MRVRLLGTAAGGGFPQWNCNCINCQGVRSGLVLSRSRTQSCVAISADDQHWFLLNASPDIRTQLLSFPPLSPPPGASRGAAIEGIFLTDADLDHTLGLFVLREGSPLTIYATLPIYHALTEGLNLHSTLMRYCPVEWRNPALALSTLCYADGTASGLQYAAFPIAGKPPRYIEHRVASQAGERVGYRFHDEKTGGRLLFLPGVAVLDETVKAQMRDCDGLLLDGTFWSEQEMQEEAQIVLGLRLSRY